MFSLIVYSKSTSVELSFCSYPITEQRKGLLILRKGLAIPRNASWIYTFLRVTPWFDICLSSFPSGPLLTSFYYFPTLTLFGVFDGKGFLCSSLISFSSTMILKMVALWQQWRLFGLRKFQFKNQSTVFFNQEDSIYENYLIKFPKKLVVSN